MYFWLDTPLLAIERVAERVRRGGHNIPQDVIERRYVKGIKNLFNIFIPLYDFWSIHDNSRFPRRTIAKGESDKLITISNEESFNLMKQYAER